MPPRPLARTLLTLAVAALSASPMTSPAHAAPGLSPLVVAAAPNEERVRGPLVALWTSVRSAFYALWPAGEPGPAGAASDKANSTTDPWGSVTPSPQPTEGPGQPGAPPAAQPP